MRNSEPIRLASLAQGGLGIRNLICHREPQPQSGRFGAWQSRLVFFLFVFLQIFVCPAFAEPSTPAQSTTKSDKSLPTVTTIPNPARGKKMNFRVMSSNPCKVRIKIYNRFFDPVAKLEQEGDHLFDILWSLKNVSDGPYIYQVLIDDKTTGETIKLPQQKFWVMKDEIPEPKNKKPSTPFPSKN